MSTTRVGALPGAAATVGAPKGHWLAVLESAVALCVLIEPLAGLGLGGAAQRAYWVFWLAWLTCTAWGLRVVVAGART
jgi:hypothetical protein